MTAGQGGHAGCSDPAAASAVNDRGRFSRRRRTALSLVATRGLGRFFEKGAWKTNLRRYKPLPRWHVFIEKNRPTSARSQF